MDDKGKGLCTAELCLEHCFLLHDGCQGQWLVGEMAQASGALWWARSSTLTPGNSRDIASVKF